MKKVSYASIIDSLIYDMVFTRLDVTHDMKDMIRFLSNPDKDHW